MEIREADNDVGSVVRIRPRVLHGRWETSAGSLRGLAPASVGAVEGIELVTRDALRDLEFAGRAVLETRRRAAVHAAPCSYRCGEGDRAGEGVG